MTIEGEGEITPENDFSTFEKMANGEEEAAPAAEEPEKQGEAEKAENAEAEKPEQEQLDDQDEDEDDGGEDDSKPKKPASERIRELNRKLRAEQRARENDRLGFEARLEKLEKAGKIGLTDENSGGKTEDTRTPPDPTDLKKYPLGSLDDRYIQDAIDFKAEEAAKKMVDSLLQRQEQSEEEAQAEAALQELRSKADDVAAKGSEIHKDYDEVVVAAGMRGDYDLTQVTFEAAAEAEHGAQILYDLATDPKEAARVAKLSSYQQLKYVSEKNAAIAQGRAGKKIPGAAPPPEGSAGGRTKRTTISPDTTNFAEFERLANQK